jgi:hypothetical protein
MKRYAMTWSAEDICDMREYDDGDYVKWADHVEETCAMRDKLLELAKECSDCEGTGMQTIFGAVLDCPACHDIRELLA